MFYTTFSTTTPPGLIQGHLCHCTVYVICPNRAPGELTMLTPGTHKHTHRFSHQVLLDRITPRGAAPVPPGSHSLSLFLSFPAPSHCNMVMSLPIRPSCHCTVVCVYVRQLHCLTPGVDTVRQTVMEAAT